MEERKRKEKELHDFFRNERLISSGKFNEVTENKKYYAITRKSRGCVDKWLGENCKGKKVLDYCCGNGRMSEKMFEMGASEVTGIDISDVSIENAKRHMQKELLGKKVHFFVMDAEKMIFKNDSFDVIFESGVLHHLDLNNAYSELARVLKPGGKCICAEALGHNKLIQMYREKTPHLRTEWETKHILFKKDIEKVRHYFDHVEILGFFHLVSLAAVPLRKLFVFRPILSLLEAIDEVLLRLPFLKWQAWQVVFVISDPKKDIL